MSGLQSQMIGINDKYHCLQGSYLALQRNFAFMVENQGREVEKINLERDSTVAQLVALQSSLEGSKSTRIREVMKLIDSHERLTAGNAAIKHKLAMFTRHLEDWKRAFLELEIYSRGLESLLYVRGFTRSAMPSRPCPQFDVAVKQELAT